MNKALSIILLVSFTSFVQLFGSLDIKECIKEQIKNGWNLEPQTVDLELDVDEKVLHEDQKYLWVVRYGQILQQHASDELWRQQILKNVRSNLEENYDDICDDVKSGVEQLCKDSSFNSYYMLNRKLAERKFAQRLLSENEQEVVTARMRLVYTYTLVRAVYSSLSNKEIYAIGSKVKSAL